MYAVGYIQASLIKYIYFAEKKPVEEAPSFPDQLEDMTVDQDQDIRLLCQVKGNPRPTVSTVNNLCNRL